MVLAHVGNLTLGLQQIVKGTAHGLAKAGSRVLLALRGIGTTVPGYILFYKAIGSAQVNHKANSGYQNEQQDGIEHSQSASASPLQRQILSSKLTINGQGIANGLHHGHGVEAAGYD